MSRKLFNVHYCRSRGAAVPDINALDVRTTTAVAWLIIVAASMRFVMCSRWSSSAVPLTEPNVCLVELRLMLAAQWPLTWPTDPRDPRVLREWRGNAAFGSNKAAACRQPSIAHLQLDHGCLILACCHGW